jgi:hypothetical protein
MLNIAPARGSGLWADSEAPTVSDAEHPKLREQFKGYALPTG